MKLNVFDAVFCSMHHVNVNIEACRGRKTIKACPYFKGKRKTKGLFPILAEIDCSYKKK